MYERNNVDSGIETEILLDTTALSEECCYEVSTASLRGRTTVANFSIQNMDKFQKPIFCVYNVDWLPESIVGQLQGLGWNMDLTVRFEISRGTTLAWNSFYLRCIFCRRLVVGELEPSNRESKREDCGRLSKLFWRPSHHEISVGPFCFSVVIILTVA